MQSRFYKEEDYPSVSDILKNADLFDDVWDREEGLKKKIERDPESILLAEVDGRVVGCVFFSDDGWNFFVWRLAVLEEFRRQGIGAFLLENVEAISRKRGMKECALFVDVSKEELKDWYQRRGYKKTRDYSFLYKTL